MAQKETTQEAGRMRGRAVIALLIVLPLVLAFVGVAYVLNPAYGAAERKAHAATGGDAVPPRKTTARDGSRSQPLAPSPEPRQNEKAIVATGTSSYRPRRPRVPIAKSTSVRTTRATTPARRSTASTKRFTSTESTSTPAATTSSRLHEDNVRLPKDLKPQHYDLEIEVPSDPYSRTYNGTVTLTFQCLKSTSQVVFHASSSMVLLGHRLRGAVSVRNVTRAGSFSTLRLNASLEPLGVYELSIDFIGSFSDGHGFYKDTHLGKGTRTYATFFQRIGARETFPCFDEPMYKATFNITIVHPKELSAVSNMPLGSRKARTPTVVADTFQRTPVMSTYLVAWYISENVCVTRGKVNLWAPKSEVGKSGSIVEMATWALDYFEKFFDIEYPLPKLDIASVYKFEYSGMQHWGLILLSVENLYEDVTTARTVVLHEVCRQWIGDLVTVNWWNEVWIQEATAHHISSIVSQTYDASPRYVYHVIDGMFSTASGRGSQLTSIPENSPYSSEDQLQFSTHDKRAHYLVRMMHFLLGDEDFKAGMSHFLKRYSFKNVGEDEFLGALSEAQKTSPKVDLKYHMESWLKSDSYPEVTFHRNYENRAVTIRQRCQKANGTYIFHVPITYQEDKVQDVLKPAKPNVTWISKQEVLIADKVGNETAVIVNPASGGYYLLNYDTRNWALVCKHIVDNPDQTDPLTMVKLLYDVDYYYKKNETDVESVLWTWLLLQNQTDHALWAREQHRFGELDAYLARFPDFETYNVRVLDIVGAVAKTLTYELPYIGPFGSDSLIWLLRLVCAVGHPMCVRPTLRLWKRGVQASHGISHFKNWLLEQGGIYYGEVVPCLAIRHEVPGALTTLYEWMQGKDTWAAMAAFACADNYTLLKDAIKDAISKDTASGSSRISLDIFRPPASFRRAFVDAFLELSPSDARYINREYLKHFQKLVDNFIDTEDQLKQVEEHSRKVLGLSTLVHDPTASPDSEPATARLRRMRRDEAGLRRWLQGQLPPIGSYL